MVKRGNWPKLMLMDTWTGIDTLSALQEHVLAFVRENGLRDELPAMLFVGGAQFSFKAVHLGKVIAMCPAYGSGEELAEFAHEILQSEHLRTATLALMFSEAWSFAPKVPLTDEAKEIIKKLRAGVLSVSRLPKSMRLESLHLYGQDRNTDEEILQVYDIVTDGARRHYVPHNANEGNLETVHSRFAPLWVGHSSKYDSPLDISDKLR